MKNQTDLHRMKIDQGGVSISRSIHQNLRVNFSISNLVITYGEQFIDVIMGQLPEEDRELILFSQEFWKWWNVQWYRCDCKLYDRPLDVKSWLTAHCNINTDHQVRCLFWANVDRFIEDGTQFMLKGGKL